MATTFIRKNRPLRRSKTLIVSLIVLIVLLYIYVRWSQPNSTSCENLCPYISKLRSDRLTFSSSHSIRHFPDFICPQNFRNLADWVYGWPDQFFEQLDQTNVNGKEIAPCLPSGSIIYVRIKAIEEFFTKIYPRLIHDFVLITGEGDVSAPNNLSYLNRPDSKIIHWFGQNGQIHSGTNPKFTHIPIGINCYEMSDAIKMVYKTVHVKRLSPSLYGDGDEPSNYVHPLDMTEKALSSPGIDQEHLALINFEPSTDGTGLRVRIWSEMCNPDQPIPFVKCIRKPAGVQIFGIQRVYPRNRRYAFWISPRGNGIDCHRTWEALYLDIIPIVWNSTLISLYTNLPVVVINHHKEITETFLREQLREISLKKKANGNFSSFPGYQYEKLHHAYWRRTILSKSRYATSMSNVNNQRRCWRAKSTLLEWTRYIPFMKYTSL